MQPISLCCQSASTTSPIAVVDDPFSLMIVLDYYDGPTSGFLQCKVCGAEYHFDMLDWDDRHDVRFFALAPLLEPSLQRLFTLVEATPDRHVWIPPVLARASEETISHLYDHGLQDMIDRVTPPTIVIAWSIRTETTWAMRGIDPVNAPDLSPWFERQPQPVAFDWFHYLRLARPLQPA